MKKLFILLFFLPFISKAQVVVPRSPKTVAVQDAYLYSTFGLKVPIYGDTTAANLMMGHDSLGLMIETITPAAIYFRAVSLGSTNKWTILASTPASPIWGLITGTLSSQLDLQAALNAKQNTIFLGTTAQYFRGDLSLATFPTDLASFTNGPGYLTAVTSSMSITGAGTSGSPLKFVNDATSPGANQFYGTDNGGTKQWLPNVDTTTVTAIGTGSPQIQTLFTSSDGNLRTSRFIQGIFTIPVQNGDSAVHIDLDTTGVGGAAYKAWIIAQYGPPMGGSGTNIYNSNGTLTDNRHLSGPLTVGAPTKTLYFDSLFNFYINASGLGNGVNITGLQSTSNLQVGVNEVIGSVFGASGTTVGYDDNQGDSIVNGVLSNTDSARIAITSGKIRFRQTAGLYVIQNLVQANDTTTFKPLAANSAGTVKRMDGWAGSGGGGSSGYSVTTAVNTSNYTVPTGRKVYVKLSDLTGQANRNVVLPAATTGDEFVFTNVNTPASTFTWTFTSGTVKDYGQNTITTLTNLTVYHLVYDGTNYQIIN